MFPMYCNSVLNNWHFFRDILSLFFRNAFHKSSNFTICALFEDVNNSKSSIIASQCFLLCKHSKIAFVYDCKIEGEMFNPMGILWYKYEALPKYGSIPKYLFQSSKALMSKMHLLNLILIVPHIWSFQGLKMYLWLMDMPNCSFLF